MDGAVNAMPSKETCATIAFQICVLLIFNIIPAWCSEKNPHSRIETFKQRQQDISHEIKKGRKELEAIGRREAEVIERLNRLEQALDKCSKRVTALKQDMEKLQKKIDGASEQLAELRERIRSNQETVARRLVAFYKIKRLGRFSLLASAESLNEFLQRQSAFKRILAYDENVRQNLKANQAELKKILQGLDEDKVQRSAVVVAYQEQTRLMTREREERTKLLAAIRGRKELELAAIDALSHAAEELDRKIKSINSNHSEADEDLKPSQLSFSDHKGLLIMPVKGKITNLFGTFKDPKYHVTNFRSGIDIETEKGEPIRSVFRGSVIYSDWFKGYGNMIIIDHGDSYYTVYAHLEEAFKSTGDKVDTSEVIATVGETGSMTGDKLYFEVRHHGKPVNPLVWLKKG